MCKNSTFILSSYPLYQKRDSVFPLRTLTLNPMPQKGTD